MILPMNTSAGGLTDAGRPYPGFLNFFYSIIAILVVVPEIFSPKDGLFYTLRTILEVGVGFSNLLLIFSPAGFLLNSKNEVYLKYLMAGCAVYICTIGSMLSYHFYPIRYGHYIWCLSFILVAFSLFIKGRTKNFIP